MSFNHKNSPLRHIFNNKINYPWNWYFCEHNYSSFITHRLFKCLFFTFSFFRGRPAHLHLGDSASSETEGVEDPEHYDDHVIVQLSARVQDGTRCRTGSLDMCIQGKCQVSEKRTKTCEKKYYCHALSRAKSTIEIACERDEV